MCRDSASGKLPVCSVDPPPGAIMHAWELIDQCYAGGVPTDGTPIPPVCAKTAAKWSACLDANPRLLIVGGGLTAVHLFRRAVQTHSCEHVHLISRSDEFLVKQFDINLEWVSYTTRLGMLASFFREKDPRKRLKALQAARGRGSITPEARLDLDAALQVAIERAGGADACDVSVETGVSISAAAWVSAEARSATGTGEWEVHMEDGTVRAYDVIWLATGSHFDVRKDPLLGDLLSQQPIEVAGGLPCLEPTLRWHPGCEVFVMGPFAALALGPDALNLTGARTGACRIGSVLRPALQAALPLDRCGPTLDGPGHRQKPAGRRNRGRKAAAASASTIPHVVRVGVASSPSVAIGSTKSSVTRRDSRSAPGRPKPEGTAAQPVTVDHHDGSA